MRKISIIVSSILTLFMTQCSMSQELPDAQTRPLFKAVLYKKHKVLQELVTKNEIDVNEIACYEDLVVRPLYLAALIGHLKCVTILLAAGADPNLEDDQNQTALHVSARSGNLECLERLILAGGNVNHQSTLGVTPLMSAAGNGHIECIKLCLARGAHVNHKTPTHNVTPLHTAASNGSVEAVSALMAAGGDITEKDFTGKTPREWAASKGNIRCEQFLRHFEKRLASMIFLQRIKKEDHADKRSVSSQETLEKCAGCKKPDPLKKCSRCKKASYCGAECQKKMWSSHKQECQKIELKVENFQNKDSQHSSEKIADIPSNSIPYNTV